MPREISVSPTEHLAIDNEIRSFLTKNIIQRVAHCPGEFISHIFTRPKPDGSVRILINLSPLNDCIVYKHFKMETLHSALSLIQPNFFMASIDLKDAYYSVKIHQTYRKFLRFTWNHVLYEFTCLPMGLSCAPRIFTKLMKPIFCHLRSLGYLSVYYLDDSLLIGSTESECFQNVAKTKVILETAGFVINSKKSVFTPSQTIQFLGFILNSVNMTVALPDVKIEHVKRCSTAVLCRCHNSIRDIAKLIGIFVSCCPAVQFGQLYTRYLEMDKIAALRVSKGDFDANMMLSEAAKLEIFWWISNVDHSSKTMLEPDVDLRLYTDASLLGWGAVCLGHSTGGRWSDEESRLHINPLELRAVLFGLRSLCGSVSGLHIRVCSDNSTAVAYINNLGGTRSLKCHEIARFIFEWAVERHVVITAEHLPGSSNILADKASRSFDENTEWTLDVFCFSSIASVFGPFDIDLFASRLNTKHAHFASWKPDPNALFVDAFSRSWSNLRFYAFPPFSLLGNCIQKLINDKAEGTFVAPLWPTQTWFPALMRSLVQKPLLLPRQSLHLTHNTRYRQLNRNLRLIACSVSGVSTKAEVFRRTLQRSCLRLGEPVPPTNIRSILESGVISVVNGTSIPYIVTKTPCYSF